jgi:magnesium-transporting ATPase (P-type)
VKNCCSHYLDAEGNVQVMTDEIKGNLDNVIFKYASKALRTIAVAYKDLSPNENGPEHDEPKD